MCLENLFQYRHIAPPHTGPYIVHHPFCFCAPRAPKNSNVSIRMGAAPVKPTLSWSNPKAARTFDKTSLSANKKPTAAGARKRREVWALNKGKVRYHQSMIYHHRTHAILMTLRDSYLCRYCGIIWYHITIKINWKLQLTYIMNVNILHDYIKRIPDVYVTYLQKLVYAWI